MCSRLQSPITSSLLRWNILLSTLLSNTLSLRSSLNVSDQVSHPHKQQATLVLYIRVRQKVCSFLSDCKTAHLSTRTSESPNGVLVHTSVHYSADTKWQLCNQSTTATSASKWQPYITVLHFATFSHNCPSLRYSRTPVVSDTATASAPYETQPFRNSGNLNKYLPFQCCCRVYVVACCLTSSISCWNRSSRLQFMLTFL